MARLLQIWSWVVLILLFLSGLANVNDFGWGHILGVWLLGFTVFTLMFGLGKALELLENIQLRLNERDKG